MKLVWSLKQSELSREKLVNTSELPLAWGDDVIAGCGSEKLLWFISSVQSIEDRRK